MLTEEEFIELVEAITKPLDLTQIRAGNIESAKAANTAEAYRAARALLAYYKRKRNETNS